jgi:UTP--glucose-1-phosphate uridylyltransferase
MCGAAALDAVRPRGTTNRSDKAMQDTKRVTKAVFPVAGLGTRFLPATKASPKEMLPIVDKPLIQYAVEEAAAAGITDMVFITGRSKRAIEDHFDKNYELESELSAKKKHDLLDVAQNAAPKGINFVFIRQGEALGLGHAVLCSAPVVGNDPFAVILADDLIDAEVPVMQQMIDLYERDGHSLIGVENIARENTASYGIVAVDEMKGRLGRIRRIVEKPKPAVAPSTLGVVGRYVFSNRIFRHLRELKPGAGGELQLTDAIAALLAEKPVYAYEFEGTRYDCGDKLGYMRATVAFGLRHPEIGAPFREYVDSVCAQMRGAQRDEARLRDAEHSSLATAPAE